MNLAKKMFLAVVAFGCFAVSVALSGCSEAQSADTRSQRPTLSPPGLTGDALAFSKFTEPVTVRIGMRLNPVSYGLPPGDTYMNNSLTRYLKDAFNINIEVGWTAASGADYDQRVALAIASNALPDGLNVLTKAPMMRAAQSGMLYDLTELFDMYASSQVKAILNSFDGRGIESVMIDGRMMALPNVGPDSGGVIVLNIFKNWLDMYDLPVPRTLDDIENIARVFKDMKPAGDATIPIVGPDKNGKLYMNFYESANQVNGFDPVFAAYDVYPGYFIDNGDGTVVYGSLDPRMKEPLERLARWYREGLIDPEMGVRDDSGELINANVGGIRFAPWWGLGYGNVDSFKNDHAANWQAYPIYSLDGKWNSKMKSPGSEALIVSANVSADTAAAIIIMYNALVRDEAIMDLSIVSNYYPLRTNVATADESEYTHRELLRVLRGEAEPEEFNDPMSIYKFLYSDATVIRDVIPNFDPTKELSVLDFNQENQGYFNRAYALLIGDRPFSQYTIDKKVYSITYTMTDLLERRWVNLKTMEDEIMMGIVTGKLDISAFDEFVQDWLNQGGQDILNDLATRYLQN